MIAQAPPPPRFVALRRLVRRDSSSAGARTAVLAWGAEEALVTFEDASSHDKISRDEYVYAEVVAREGLSLRLKILTFPEIRMQWIDKLEI